MAEKTKAHDEDEDTSPEDTSPESDDDDDDYEDDSEDEDNEDDGPAKKGVGDEPEVAVVDGDAVMSLIGSTIEKAVSEAVEYALPALVAAFLVDESVLGKHRSMIGGQVKKALDTRIGSLTEAADRLEKALGAGTLLVKGIGDAEDEAARTEPALKTVAMEVLEKGIGVGGAVAAPEDVDALIEEGKAIQMRKGTALPILSDFLGLDFVSRHEASNIASLKKGIEAARL